MRAGLALLLLVPAAAPAVDWESNRLREPRKITVGPADNAGAAVEAGGGGLYFSRVRSQVPGVFRQDLRTQRARAVLPGRGDARAPAVGPEGTPLALVSYRFDARGDICLYRGEKAGLECLTEPGRTERAPFWAGAGRVGWLQRPASGDGWALVVQDLGGGERRTLAEGALSAPAADPSGRYVVYNRAAERPGDRPRLEIHDRRTGRTHRPPRFDLPGITGSLAFSREGRYLYFTHYLNDTSLDQVIDGADHGVVLRVRFQRLLTAEAPFLPEQLTSVARNCRFPALGPGHLYLTCAFEGSLDIYRLPAGGAVPADWDEEKLRSAYRAARTHPDRLLLLNTLRYRHGGADPRMVERLLSHHLEIGELRAAGYYVAELRRAYAERGRDRLAAFYRMLGPLLEVRSLEKRQPRGVRTTAFLRRVRAVRRELQRTPVTADQGALLAAYLDVAEGERRRALERLDGLRLAEGDLLPLGRYLAFALYRRLLEERDPGRLLDHYPAMYGAADLSREARLYYAFRYLRLLARLHGSGGERLEILGSRLTEPPGAGVAALFRAERAALELAAAEGEEARQAAYREIRELLSEAREDPVLRRVQHVRAIRVLGAADDYEYMELLSRHWLLSTHVSEMGFPYVAEQYAVAVTDKAYGLLAQGEGDRAFLSFYSVLRQTNDLEAHYRYITLGLGRLDRSDEVERSYGMLRERELLGESGPYVRALRLLLPDSGRPTDEELDRAIALLEELPPTGISPAMGELLLGYAHHRKLARGRKGRSYDKGRFQQAHRHYMLALDLAHENARIRAAVLQNLGLLHVGVGNYAMAADFYGRRAGLPFASGAGEAALRWKLARALFYVDRPDRARRQAELGLDVAERREGLAAAPFREKAAFYALQAGAYEAATAHYAALLEGGGAPEGAHGARIRLAYGYALLKAERPEAARKHLRAAGAGGAPPPRRRLLALGLLAEAAPGPAEAAGYRRERIALWERFTGEARRIGYSETDRLRFLSKDYQQVAAAEERLGRIGAAREAILRGLAAAREWAATTGSPGGVPVYHGLVNYLSLGVRHPEVFDGADPEWLGERMDATLAAYADLPGATAITRTRQLKLRMLWKAYGRAPAAPPPRRILESEAARSLKAARPGLYGELEALADRLTSL
ncbi:hypothetical protein [Thiohalorhabdus methylotrophus]|uniref:Tetratricopeptide repeat protein n=1 Tax=Thiohalorhabdus methylotrophus TaxID=3242694 RepID=A0ABV4TUC2_9GAMM